MPHGPLCRHLRSCHNICPNGSAFSPRSAHLQSRHGEGKEGPLTYFDFPRMHPYEQPTHTYGKQHGSSATTPCVNRAAAITNPALLGQVDLPPPSTLRCRITHALCLPSICWAQDKFHPHSLTLLYPSCSSGLQSHPPSIPLISQK